MSYDMIDKAQRRKRQPLSLHLVEYETENRHYAHVDCPGMLTMLRI